MVAILEIPEEIELQAAVRKVALRQGQLEHVLRLTVKSVEGLTYSEAMESTRRLPVSRLRRRILESAQARISETWAMDQLTELIQKSKRASDKRNRMIHAVWARNRQNELIIRDDDRGVQPCPRLQELEALADELATALSDLNEARLNGFLRNALRQHQS